MTTQPPEKPPVWAHGFKAPDYRRFVELVRVYFSDREIEVDLDIEAGIVRTELGGRMPQSAFGLQNLAQMCHQADLDAWRDIVRSHFDTVFAVSDDANALRVDMSDFARFKGLLRARLYPEEITHHSDELTQRAGPPGTLEVLVVDLPTSVRTVSRTEAAAWPLSLDALFELARENLLGVGLLPVTSVEIERGVQLRVIRGDPYYTASHMLWLDRYLPPNLPHGVLVAIPKRDVILLHEIRSVAVVEAVTALLRITIGMHRDGPGSLSPNVYWAKAGAFIELPYRIEGETLRFVPPDPFVALLETLTRGATLS